MLTYPLFFQYVKTKVHLTIGWKKREKRQEKMAEKEIQIRFKAETSEFTNGIKDINSDIGKLRNELKLNSTQLKGSADDVDLLKERKQMLAQELEKSKNKVELTNQTLEKAKEIYGEDSDKVRKYENDLINAQNQEQAIRNELEDTNKELKNQKNDLQNASDALGIFGTNVEDAGKKMSVVTGVVAGVTAASVKSAMDMDKGYDTVITKTGATGEALDELTDSMDNIFKSLPIDAETAGIAVGEVNTRFGETDEALEDLSEKFIQFSNINSTDLNASIDNTDAIMTKFNVDTKDTGSVLGLMTKAGQDTGISMDTLQNTLSTNGATLKEMGLDITSSVNLLAQMEANGVDASAAIAGLKKAQQNATAEGRSMKEALDTTISSIQNAESETDALQIATELFGKKGAAEMTQAIREGRFSVEDLSSSLSDYEKVVSTTYENTLSPWDKSKVTMNNLKVAGSDLAGSVLEELSPAIEGVSEKIEGFSNWFSDLDSKEQMQIVTIAGVVAAIGPALIVIGKVSQGVKAVTSVLGAAKAAMAAHAAATAASTAATTGETVAQTGLNTAFLACPITWIVLAIIGLVAGIILLWNKCEGFRNAVTGIWNGIKEVFSGAIDGIKGAIEGAKEGIESFKGKMENAKEKCSETLGKMKEGAKEKLNGIKNIYEENGGGIKGLVAVQMAGQKALFEQGYNAINTLTGGKLDKLKDIAKEKMGSVKEKFKDGIEKVKDIFDFNIKWPDIKMPSITVTYNTSGGLAKAAKFLGLEGMPKFNIKWNAEGVILKKPTIFGFANGMLQGGGEAGQEAVLPIEKLEDQIGNKMAEFVSLIPTINYEKLAAVIAKENAKQNIKIVLNNRELGRAVHEVM